jgi:hypothetical protein
VSRFATATTLGLLTAALIAFFYFRDTTPDFGEPALLLTDSGLSQPGDVVRFQGRYVATELYKNRLAIFDDLALNNLEHFEPETINEQFRSPHFLAVTPWDTLLISNGWGDSIVEIADLEGNGWKEFSGIGRPLRGPHGICIDNEGWIYVGDSLNSRLVRFKDMDGTGWEVFEDAEQRISYIRELACRNGVVWASNSYENRPGLNPGEGSNLLKITDFESGRLEIVASFPGTNTTGVLPVDDDTVVVGLWGLMRRLTLVDTRSGDTDLYARHGFGTPYGTYHDAETGAVLVTYVGRLSGEETRDVGGIGVYR